LSSRARHKQPIRQNWLDHNWDPGLFYHPRRHASWPPRLHATNQNGPISSARAHSHGNAFLQPAGLQRATRRCVVPFTCCWSRIILSSGGHTGVLRCQLRAVRAPPTSFAASALGGDGPPLLFAVVGAARAQTPICVGTGEGVRGVVGDGGGLPMRRVRLRRGRRRCLGLGAVYPVEGGTATPTKEGR
jgi:hypothetical protein